MEVFDGRALPITHCNGNKEAILCIHEFAATPYSFSYTAQKLAEVGYDLFVPLLPGCGTSPKEFISTRFSDWYNYIKEFYLDLCAKYKAITLVGASLGGAMALTLAAEFGKELHSSTPSTLGGYPPKRVVTIGAVAYIFSPLKNSWMRPDSLLVRPASASNTGQG